MKKALSLILVAIMTLGAFGSLPAYAAKPAKPVNVHQSAASTSSVKIKWNAVEGNKITYELRYTASGQTNTLRGISSTSAIVKGLSAGSTCKVKIRAVKGSDKGSWSDEIKTVTCCNGTAVKQTKALDGAVKISWSAVKGATGYNIYSKGATDAGNSYKLLASTDSTKATVKLKSNNYTKDFLALVVSPVRTVKGYSAENKLGSLPKGCILEYPKAIPVKADVPTYSSGKLSMTVDSWVSGMKYAVYELDGKKVKSATVSADSKSKATVSFDAEAGVIYKVHARGYVNIGGTVSYGETSAVGYIAKAPAVSANWDNGVLKVQWSKLSGATSYNVEVKNNNDSDNSVKIKNIKTTSYNVKAKKLSGLNVNKSYTVKVKPYKSSAGLSSGKTTTFKVEVIGHRGCMDEAPENTFASYELAYKHGYDSTEADFWETTSGDLIISHEKMLTQCGHPEKDVRTLTKATLKKYPVVKGKNVDKFPKQYLPTLEQLVKRIASYKMRLLLHLKDVNMSDAGIQKVYDILGKYNMLDKTVVLSSNTNAVKRIVNAKLAASFLYVPKSGDDVKKCIDFSSRNKIGMMIFRYNEYLNKSYVDYARKQTVRVGCYNVNNKKTAGEMSNMGCDFLITNKNYFT